MSEEDVPSNEAYLKHLQGFNEEGGAVKITANIHNEQGVLLLSKGEKLTDQSVDKIIQHKLNRPLEDCVGLEPMLNPKQLRARFEEVLAAYPDVAKVFNGTQAPKVLLPCLIAMQDYATVFQKLTVMAHRMDKVFERVLVNAALVLAVSMSAKIDKKEIIKRISTTLIQDLGYLHLPESLSQQFTPDIDVLKAYYAHPLVSQQIAKQVHGLPASVVRAVGEHHERFDGSGFPKGIALEKLSQVVQYTGMVDELTRIMFSRGDKPKIDVYEAFLQLQFRRTHFCDQTFAEFQVLLNQHEWPLSPLAGQQDLRTFSRLQLVYYAQCLFYCDVIARIQEASQLDHDCVSIRRIHIKSKSTINTIYASGMLSLPIRRFIEEVNQNPSGDFLLDMIEIDHSHLGILDCLEEIFLQLEYIIEVESKINEISDAPAFIALEGCYAYLKHLQFMKGASRGWESLVNELHGGANDLSSIIESIQV